MADVLSKSNLFSVYDNRSLLISHRRPNFSAVSFSPSKSRSFQGLRSCSTVNGNFGNFGDRDARSTKENPFPKSIQMTLAYPKALKWWTKGVQPNMKEIESAQDLVGSLLNAGDKLVVVEFFSPSCAACKFLHPKLCQLAEKNPDVLFLQVNNEEHRSLSYSLHIHVLPFFRFYRGADGRIGSFSCTLSTIKKLKDALAKHSTERCSLGPAKGLEESELLALAAKKELSFLYPKKKVELVSNADDMADVVNGRKNRGSREFGDKDLVLTGR